MFRPTECSSIISVDFTISKAMVTVPDIRLVLNLLKRWIIVFFITIEIRAICALPPSDIHWQSDAITARQHTVGGAEIFTGIVCIFNFLTYYDFLWIIKGPNWKQLFCAQHIWNLLSIFLDHLPVQSLQIRRKWMIRRWAKFNNL